MFIFLYGFGAAATAFGVVWLLNLIQKDDPCFLKDVGVFEFSMVAAFWPFAAPIIFGILGAKYLIGKEK